MLLQADGPIVRRRLRGLVSQVDSSWIATAAVVFSAAPRAAVSASLCVCRTHPE